MLEKLFHIRESGSTVRTEIVAGITTFMTMAYIIFVNPNFLSQAGMDVESVLTATCLSSALATLLMAFIANYPIALAPGMGMNAFFTYTICIQMKVPWQIALGMVFLSSLLFLVLAFWGVREAIFRGLPECIKYGTAAGIGLFIAFIGLQEAGIVVRSPGTLVDIGNLRSRPALLALAGLLITTGLMARRVKGAILIGLLATGVLGIPLGIVQLTRQGIVEFPALSPTFLKLDILGALKPMYIGPILVFLFFAMFDAIGTLVGVKKIAS